MKPTDTTVLLPRFQERQRKCKNHVNAIFKSFCSNAVTLIWLKLHWAAQKIKTRCQYALTEDDENDSYLFGNDCNTYCHSETNNSTPVKAKQSNSSEQMPFTSLIWLNFSVVFNSTLKQLKFHNEMSWITLICSSSHSSSYASRNNFHYPSL